MVVAGHGKDDGAAIPTSQQAPAVNDRSSAVWGTRSEKSATTNALMDAVYRLAIIQPIFTEEMPLQLEAFDVQTFCSVVRDNKVVRIVSERLAEIAASHQSSATVASLHRILNDWSIAQARRDHRRKELIDNLRLRVPPRLPVALMKGVAAAPWYPGNCPRDVGDLDVWVPDVDSGWELAGYLLSEGYQHSGKEPAWLKGLPGSGQPYGQVHLDPPLDGDCPVDIHIGPYSVRHCGLMHFRTDGLIPWNAMPKEETLCSVVANSAGDWFLDIKTLNDVALCLGNPLDVSYIRDLLGEAELLGYFVGILDRLLRVSQLSTAEYELAQELRNRAIPDRVPPPDRWDRSQRRRIVAHHSYRIGRRTSRRAGIRNALGAWKAYGRKTTVRIARVTRSSHPMSSLAPNQCVRLIPASRIGELAVPSGRPVRTKNSLWSRLELTPRVAVLNLRKAQLVEIGREAFVPTVNFRIPKGLASICRDDFL